MFGLTGSDYANVPVAIGFVACFWVGTRVTGKKAEFWNVLTQSWSEFPASAAVAAIKGGTGVFVFMGALFLMRVAERLY